MLAFFASVDQPHVDVVPVGVYSEFAGIEKFMLFSATSTPVKHTDTVCFFDLPLDRVFLAPDSLLPGIFLLIRSSQKSFRNRLSL